MAKKQEKCTSRHWAVKHKEDISILNRTGWEKGWYSWGIERITLEEFKSRANASAVELKNPKFLPTANTTSKTAPKEELPAAEA